MVFGICTPVNLLPSIYDPKREWRGVSAGTRDWGLDLQPPLYLDFGDYARTVSRRLVHTKNLKESNRRQQLRQFVWICLRRKQDTHVIPEVYWSIVHFLLGNALGDQISDAWFPPFLVSDGESIN